jgi:hypothetical protein
MTTAKANTIAPQDRRLHALILLVTTALAACSSGTGNSSASAGRDSAGIVIVESTSPSWPDGAGWRLTEEPVLEIGALDGALEYQLFRVFDATRLADGRIVVANSGTHELRFYESDGTYIRTAGRQGAGPGEFQGLMLVESFAGDSLLTYDWRNRRITVFSPGGEFVRSFTPDALAGTPFFPNHVLPLKDGSLILGVASPPAVGRVATGVSQDTMVIVRADMDGATLDTIADYPGAEIRVQTAGSGERTMVMAGPRLWSPSPQMQGYANGFYLGNGASFEITYYGQRGAVERLIRLDQPNLPVTSEDIERYKEERLAQAEDENTRRRALARMENMQFTETFPAYDGLLVDPAGSLWVREFRRPGAQQQRWKVFDGGGALLGTVEMPQELRAYQIGDDFVLGRWIDELDVEHVRLYGILKD